MRQLLATNKTFISERTASTRSAFLETNGLHRTSLYKCKTYQGKFLDLCYIPSNYLQKLGIFHKHKNAFISNTPAIPQVNLS